MANLFNQKSSQKLISTILLIFFLTALAGFLIYPQAWDKTLGKLGVPYLVMPFKLGLDLQGGTHLVYEPDLTNLKTDNLFESMEGVRDVIERRINAFGIAEPVIQINQAGDHYRLIVELAGIQDVNQAIEMIGQTPSLDFREQRPAAETETLLAQQQEIVQKYEQGLELTAEELQIAFQDPYYQMTELTGRYLDQAHASQDQMGFQYQVNLQFDQEGAVLFEQITDRNIGRPLAIYLDNQVISAPIVQDKITGGEAQISGDFSAAEARLLTQRLNAGALPVPINLISQQTVGATLGQVSLEKSLTAGFYGLGAILIFLIAFYRLPGLLASVSLLIYLILTLALFKILGVVLTLAGIAGFILSLGFAVDANILIFTRFKEEFKLGKSLGGSIDDGFAKAWSAIRDGNISTLITCFILFFFSAGLIKGFALTLGIGILVSIFTAVVVTKSFMKLSAKTKLAEKRKLWA